MINSVPFSSAVSDNRNRTFPIYDIVPTISRNNKPLSVINPNRTRPHTHTRTRNNHDNHYSFGYLVICMIMSCMIGLIAMQNYIITYQQITVTESGYVATIFGEDYLYR